MTTTMMLVADLRLHPAAERVPVMTPDEHDALVIDVEQRGVVTPLDILADGTILDGRHRWQVASTLGIEKVPVRIVDPADPVDFMVRAAVLRRHLTTPQRKALAASLLTAEPSRSDRSVARAVGVDHKTVASVRDDLVGRGEVPHVESRTDTVGRSQPSKRRSPFEALAAAAGVSVEDIERVSRIEDQAPDLLPAIRAGEITLDEAEARVSAASPRRTQMESAAPGPTLVPPASKELRPAGRKDMLLVPRMLASARVLARVRPSGIAMYTPSKDRPKMAARIREMIVVLEAVAQAMDEGTGR